jgi:hypothetical protein
MRLGSAVHGYLEALNRGTDRDAALAVIPDAAARELCAGVDPTQVPIGVPEVPYVYDVRTGAARRLTATTGGHRGYGDLSDTAIPGTIDLLVEGRAPCGDDPGTRWTVIDWSTDHDLDLDHKRAQVEVYMLAVARAHKLPHIDGAIGTFRLGGALSWHRWSLDGMGLADVAARLRAAHDAAVAARHQRAQHEREHAAPWTPDVTRGGHCRDCRAMLHCPATQAMVRAVGVPDASIGTAYTVAQTAERWGKEVRDHARQVVDANGFVPLPDGKRLVKRTDKRGTVSLRVVRASTRDDGGSTHSSEMDSADA